MVAKRLPAFERFADWLREQGYQVVRTQIRNTRVEYSFWKVVGKNITGGFCEPNKEAHKQINGRFAADHEKAFDKWSKCPLVVAIKPTMDLEDLKRHLDYLGSDAGFEHSNSYAYLDETVLPRVA